jgi:hypothetical protein
MTLGWGWGWVEGRPALTLPQKFPSPMHLPTKRGCVPQHALLGTHRATMGRTDLDLPRIPPKIPSTYALLR